MMLVKGGEFHSSSSGGMAAESVNDGCRHGRMCTSDSARKSRSGPPDQI